MANGVNLAEQCHLVNALPPVSISGGKSTIAVNMGTAHHLSLVIQFGVRGAANPTSIIVSQATTEAAGTNKALPFRFYYQATSGAGNDTLLGPFYAATTGITSSLPSGAAFPTSVDSLMWVIEIDSPEVDTATAVGSITEYPYIYVTIADSGNTTFASVLAVLSGERYAYKGSPSVTV